MTVQETHPEEEASPAVGRRRLAQALRRRAGFREITVAMKLEASGTQAITSARRELRLTGG